LSTAFVFYFFILRGAPLQTGVSSNFFLVNFFVHKMNLFGKKKAEPKLSDTITLLRETVDSIDKREAYLQKQANAAVIDAKKRLLNNDKRGAMVQLKRKKMYERQLEQMLGQRMNLETQIMALEEAAITKSTLSAMSSGSVAQKQAMQEINVDKVEDMMEGINESISMADEVSAAMSQQIGPLMDDDELEQELEDMEREYMDEQLLDLRGSVPTNKLPARVAVAEPLDDAPSVPLSRGPASKPRVESQAEKEARELRQLEELMG
jgi:charged multivesicular body protein 4